MMTISVSGESMSCYGSDRKAHAKLVRGDWWHITFESHNTKFERDVHNKYLAHSLVDGWDKGQAKLWIDTTIKGAESA